MSRSVSVDVDVDLDMFDDDDILDAAVCIVRQYVKDGGKRSLLAAPVEKLRAILRHDDDEDAGEPLSTAAKLQSMAELRNWMASDSASLFHFLGEQQ